MKTYDCETCPLSWEDMGYDGECYDCGCIVHGDFYGDKLICRFPNFIKSIIWKIKDSIERRRMAHEDEGVVEWQEEQERKDAAFKQAIEECILTNEYGENLVLCRKDKDGKFCKAYIGENFSLARMRYEEILESEVNA